MKYDKDEIVLRKVSSREIVFHSKDINEVIKESEKYPWFEVSVETLTTEGAVIF